jgi:hypothetical protein
MLQVIENIGGWYRNRTDLHGFAIRIEALKSLEVTVNALGLFTAHYQ